MKKGLSFGLLCFFLVSTMVFADSRESGKKVLAFSLEQSVFIPNPSVQDGTALGGRFGVIVLERLSLFGSFSGHPTWSDNTFGFGGGAGIYLFPASSPLNLRLSAQYATLFDQIWDYQTNTAIGLGGVQLLPALMVRTKNLGLCVEFVVPYYLPNQVSANWTSDLGSGTLTMSELNERRNPFLREKDPTYFFGLNISTQIFF